MKRKITILNFAILSALLLASCAGQTGQKESGVDSSQANASAALTSPNKATVPGSTGLLAAYEGDLENVYTQTNPSVVNIHVVQKQEITSINPFSNFPFFFNTPGFGNTTPQTPQYQYNEGLGSGFVWDKQGHIVTNNHVVNGADKIEVTFADGSTVPATVVGTDPDSDLAVIQVEVAADKLQPVKLADSKQVKVGQLAVAIGNPFGLEGTMTVGIVSALGRTLPAGQGNSTEPVYTIPDIIQTDAPINPGNSGGVLVNDSGEVIGVTAAIESPSQASAGIGFAIPSELVQKVVPVLIQNKQVEHAYMGISGGTLTPEIATAMNLNPNLRGALVIDVAAGGPAAKAGILGSSQQITLNGQQGRVGGDVIVAINDTTVNNMDDLIAYLNDNTSVGQKVTLKLIRDGKEMTVDVTLEARPQ